MNFDRLVHLAADVVGATQRKLPPPLRPLARGVPVHFEKMPDEDVLADGFPPDILGLFTGSAHGHELDHTNPAPPEIILYVENLWDFAEQDPEIFREETRLTYLHELGHYFGWDEDDLAARGLD